MDITSLKQFGLTDKEAQVYVAALELGDATVQGLARKSKMKRTSIYSVLESLKDKGLISSSVRKKRRYYHGSDPRDLLVKMEERKHAVRAMIPELLSITNLIERKPRIKFFEGVEGIKEIYLDVFRYPNEKIYAWVTDEVWDEMDEDFLNHYISERARRKIFAFVIAPDCKVIREYKAKDLKSFRKTQLDRGTLFNGEVEIDLYGGKNIGIMSFGEKMGLVIESEKIYNTLKSLFNIHWASLGGEAE